VKRPTRDQVRIFTDAAAMRAWLAKHHDTETEAWIGYWRKGVDRPSVAYPESVEVGLAFGWIDGISYRVDDEVRTVRFTPRRRGSNWSDLNVARMGRIIAAGDAHPSGIAAFEARVPATTGVYSYENAPRELPPEYAERMQANPAAWAYWQARSPSYRRTATHWVVSAKRQETRDRRLATLIEDCAAERPIRLLAYGRTGDTRA
jgi:uncharacterized protein YdeI (YjbR/CyaY-like superfamily)